MIVLLQFAVLKRISGRRRTRVMVVMALVWALSWLILGAAGLLPDSLAAAIGVLAFMGVFAFGETLLQPTVPAVYNDLASDHNRGRYNAINSAAFQGGAITGPIAAGLLLDQGLSAWYIAIMVVGCLGIGVLALALERRIPASANGVPEPVEVGNGAAELSYASRARRRLTPRSISASRSRRRPRSAYRRPGRRRLADTVSDSPSGARPTTTVSPSRMSPDEQRPRQLVVDLVLHEPAQRTGAVERVVAALGEPGAGVGRDRRARAAARARRADEPVDVEVDDLGRAPPRTAAENTTMSSSRFTNSGLNACRTDLQHGLLLLVPGQRRVDRGTASRGSR